MAAACGASTNNHVCTGGMSCRGTSVIRRYRKVLIPSVGRHWHAHGLSSLQYSNDKLHLFTCGEEGVLVMWHEQENLKQFLPRLGAGITRLIVPVPVQNSKNGTSGHHLSVVVAVSLADNSIVFVDTAGNRVLQTVKGIDFDFTSAATSPAAIQALPAPVFVPFPGPMGCASGVCISGGGVGGRSSSHRTLCGSRVQLYDVGHDLHVTYITQQRRPYVSRIDEDVGLSWRVDHISFSWSGDLVCAAESRNNCRTSPFTNNIGTGIDTHTTISVPAYSKNDITGINSNNAKRTVVAAAGLSESTNGIDCAHSRYVDDTDRSHHNKNVMFDTGELPPVNKHTNNVNRSYKLRFFCRGSGSNTAPRRSDQFTGKIKYYDGDRRGEEYRTRSPLATGSHYASVCDVYDVHTGAITSINYMERSTLQCFITTSMDGLWRVWATRTQATADDAPSDFHFYSQNSFGGLPLLHSTLSADTSVLAATTGRTIPLWDIKPVGGCGSSKQSKGVRLLTVLQLPAISITNEMDNLDNTTVTRTDKWAKCTGVKFAGTDKLVCVFGGGIICWSLREGRPRIIWRHELTGRERIHYFQFDTTQGLRLATVSSSSSATGARYQAVVSYFETGPSDVEALVRVGQRAWKCYRSLLSGVPVRNIIGLCFVLDALLLYTSRGEVVQWNCPDAFTGTHALPPGTDTGMYEPGSTATATATA
eukprot:Lankesteria_metandrocarpae@DN5698_c0_g1_i1.p1